MDCKFCQKSFLAEGICGNCSRLSWVKTQDCPFVRKRAGHEGIDFSSKISDEEIRQHFRREEKILECQKHLEKIRNSH